MIFHLSHTHVYHPVRSRGTKIDCTFYGGESLPNDESSQYITGGQLPPSGGWLTVANLVAAVLSNEPPPILTNLPRMPRGDYNTIYPLDSFTSLTSYRQPPCSICILEGR